jgi:GNAT superfamily N-acetyltransferase
MTSIRPLLLVEIPELLDMIRELADFEQLSHEVTATVADYERALFGDSPSACALLAEQEGILVGYAIHFSTFSSFLGKEGVWLEDLYVRPDYRGQGIGKALLKAVGRIAAERGAGRYEWSVLDWNTNAIELYKRMGGRIMNEWRIVRLSGNELSELPNK